MTSADLAIGPIERAAGALRALLSRGWAVLGAILILAALLRLIGLESRGRFDGDQGHDVLVLLRLVQDGTLPLLGPPTSIGDFHHGASYYYLLAPIAWLSGADPTAVVAWIATLGIAAVAATWWFARMVGGPDVAAIAGLLMAVSPAAIEESTFIWNPNPIPLFAALALGCAWRAHAGGSARWWVPAIVAAGMVFQLHVLGVVFLPPILALAIAGAIRARRAGDRARVVAIGRATAGGLVLAALLFVPLLVHELGSGFEETRHVVDYLAGGGDEEAPDRNPVLRLAITLLRLVGWPLAGLVTEAPVASLAVVAATVVLGARLAVAGRGSDRTVARWLGGTILWSTVALTILAPSLQTVVVGLPNDHYHAFLDPIVVVLVALGAQAVAGGPERSGRAGDARVAIVSRSVVTIALAALVVLDVRLAPPPDPNGGWPLARAAGARIVADWPGPFDVRQLPVFKTAEGVGFAIIAAGGDASVATDPESADRVVDPDATLVIACDRLFEDVMGAACDGAAESEYLGRIGADYRHYPSVVRFDLSPRISVSVYQPNTGAAAGG
ncbi:MAG: hypothetical protein EPO36_03370 [Chloroflexota bacterium]|nr:MAG: hypothetical protein EPO36_03370 [Chloroflexota bacterium]